MKMGKIEIMSTQMSTSGTYSNVSMDVRIKSAAFSARVYLVQGWVPQCTTPPKQKGHSTGGPMQRDTPSDTWLACPGGSHTHSPPSPYAELCKEPGGQGRACSVDGLHTGLQLTVVLVCGPPQHLTSKTRCPADHPPAIHLLL